MHTENLRTHTTHPNNTYWSLSINHTHSCGMVRTEILLHQFTLVVYHSFCCLSSAFLKKSEYFLPHHKIIGRNSLFWVFSYIYVYVSTRARKHKAKKWNNFEKAIDKSLAICYTCKVIRFTLRLRGAVCLRRIWECPICSTSTASC